MDGQHIQTLQHALCWTPAPPNLNVSARVLPKVLSGVWLFSSIGANALQVTLTLNFGGEGVVPDRRGLNIISSIYGTNWGVRSKTLCFHRLVQPLCFPSHCFLFPNSQLIPNCKKHCVFTGKCCMHLSSHCFLFPNSQLIPKCAKHCVFTGGRCMSLSSHFVLFPNSRQIRLLLFVIWGRNPQMVALFLNWFLKGIS